MSDFYLAALYEVPTKTLSKVVERNIKRFPKDLCFYYHLLNGRLCGHNL